ITRIDCRASRMRRSRSCKTIVVRLCPAIERLPCRLTVVNSRAAPDLPFDVGAPPCPARTAPAIQVLEVRAEDIEGCHFGKAVMFMAGFHDQTSRREILEDFCQVLSAI